ncbi:MULTISPECIES: hypothetical protein [Myxococcus]|uniref:hypothetical protein n=1 Tax=Myxococcus TaxID=32 RepID=UPI00114506DE|nr:MULTISPECIES: hypothetical protein [Myxococcus]MCK8498945.1 hypothetical protein [Myxococcus fulvus]
MSKLRHTLVMLTIPAVLWGCGPEDLTEAPGQNGAATPGAESLASTSAALVASNEFTWSQGNLAKPMGGTDGRSCFLTRVGGDLQGGGERVDIFQSGGSWYLGGASQQTGIHGAARCVEAEGDTTEYQWTQSMAYPVYMGTATNRVCYLVGIAGKFNGTGEWVHAYVSGGSWYLNGNSSQSSVRARARCINVSPSGTDPAYTNEVAWYQGSPASYLMATPSTRACGLTFVRGKFEGSGEYVRIYNDSGYWYLSGSSNQTGVAARARCF